MKVNVKNKEIYTGKAAAVNTPVPLTNTPVPLTTLTIKEVLNMTKKIIVFGVALIMCLGLFSACGGKELTEEEHVQRISERVEKRFLENGLEYSGLYTSFKVEILYDYRDEPVYFLVEFEPDGFIYGRIYKNNYYYPNFTFYKGSRSGNGDGYGWWIERYCPDEEITVFREWHYKSHFNVAGIAAERKYLFFSTNKFGWVMDICHTVKRDGIFIDVLDVIREENNTSINIMNNLVHDRFSKKSQRSFNQL